MIVLASRSPRRRALLEMLGIPHVVDPARIDERQADSEPAEHYVRRLAKEKACAVCPRHPDAWVLGADTVVEIDGEILEKPGSADEAQAMLRRLSGACHRVVTGVALARSEVVHERLDVTSVWFRPLDAQTIASYVATGEPMDKAGAYGIQGRGAVLVDRIEGDYFSVMGLPIRLVIELLDAAGQPYRFTR